MSTRFLAFVLLLGGVAALAAARQPQASSPAKTLRVGTYDSRAIAVAYAASKFNPVADKLREREAAKAAGDTRRVKELEAWGERHQRDLHRQGFGRVPVDDLLDAVRDQLPAAARAADVELIAMDVDFASPNVEEVDVTDALVRLFDPSERTLGIVKDLKKQPPISLDEVERGHAH